MSNSTAITMWHFFGAFKSKGGNFVNMNEEKNVVTKEQRNIAGIYIRVSTEDQARERI